MMLECCQEAELTRAFPLPSEAVPARKALLAAAQQLRSLAHELLGVQQSTGTSLHVIDFVGEDLVPIAVATWLDRQNVSV